MKKRNRIVSLLVCLTLLSGLMVTPAEAALFSTSYDGIVKYMDNEYYKIGPYFNIPGDLSIGLKGGKVYEGMDKDLSLYHTNWDPTTATYYRPDGAAEGYDGNVPLSYFLGKEAPIPGTQMTFRMTPEFVYGEKGKERYIRLTYQVKNNGASTETFQLGTAFCRVMMFSYKDDVWHLRTTSEKNEIKYSEGNILTLEDGWGRGWVFHVIAPSCDTTWRGYRTFWPDEWHTDNRDYKTKKDYNSAAWSWKIELKPGEDWSRYVLMTFDPLKNTPPTLNDDSTPGLVAGQDNGTITGKADPNNDVYVDVLGKEYHAKSDNSGRFTITGVSIPQDYKGNTLDVPAWALNNAWSMSKIKIGTVTVKHEPAVTLDPPSTTVMEDTTLDENWYTGFIKSSSGTVTHTTLSTSTLGEKTVTYTAKLGSFPNAKATLSVNVLPQPAQLTQAQYTQSGKNFNLSATMKYTGGLSYTETGFVYGAVQNPTLTMNDGKVTTSSVVKTKNGSLSATAANLVDGITYYARAYAKASDGTVIYGPQSGGFGLGVPSYGTFHVKNNSGNTFTIYREGGSDGVQKVYYRTVNGSAVGCLPGQNKYNFEHTDGVLTFNDGEYSKTVTVTEFSNYAQYDSYVATQYSNADRTYQMEINRVEGGAIIGTRFAERNMGHGGIYTFERNYYQHFWEIVFAGEEPRGDYDDDKLGWTDSGKVGTNASRTVAITDVLKKEEYWRATASGISYYLSFQAREEAGGYQHIQITPGGSLNTGFYPYQGYWDGNLYGNSIYAAIFEHGGGSDDKTYATYYFPSGTGSNPRTFTQEYGGTGYLTLDKDLKQVTVGFTGSGKNSDKWYTKDETHHFKLLDNQEPQLVGVADMARSKTTTTYLPGDPITVSLIFDEIVDEANSKAAGFSDQSYITLDGWGNTKFYYKGGLNTNVLYFTGTTPEGAPTGDGNLKVNLDCADQIRDMCDTKGTAPSAGGKSSTAPISSKAKPTVTVEAISNSSGTLTSQITATNAAKLEYVWTTTPAAAGQVPAYGWKIVSTTGGCTATTRQSAGTWYLYARATNEDGLTATASKSYTIPANGAGALVLPELTVSANNSAWAKTRTINITKTPSNAAVTVKKPDGTSASVSGTTYTANANGSYTFTLKSGDETVSRTVSVSRLDLNNPTVSFEALNSKTYMEPVTLTVNAADSESGIQSVSGTWNKTSGGSQPATLKKVRDGVYTSTCPNQSGTWKLTVTATDKVNNSASATSSAYPVDLSGPTVTVTLRSSGNTGYVYNYTVTQGGSAIKTVQLPGGTITTNLTGTVTLTEPGSYYVVAMDEVGHVATSPEMKVPEAINGKKIDGTAPEVQLSVQNLDGFVAVETDGEEVSWTKGPVTVTVEVHEEGSTPTAKLDGSGEAISLTPMTYEGKAIAGYYTGKFQVKENGTYSVTATDENGNQNVHPTGEEEADRDTARIVVENIDTTAPVISDPTGNPTEWTPNDAAISFTVSDPQSGVKAVTVKKGTADVTVTNNSGSCSFTADSNGTYTITVTDNVGNEATKTVEVTKISKSQPALSVTGGDVGKPATEGLELTVTAKAPDSSGVTVTVSKDGGKDETVTDGKYTVTQPGTYTFTAKTGAGNTVSQTVTVYSITFDSSGGTAVPRQVVVSGGKAAQPDPVPAKEGFTFTGWKNGEAEWNFSNTVTGNITLTAQWVTTSTITAWPTPSAITYGQTLADSVLTGGVAGIEGTFAWKDHTIRPTVADSGKTEYQVVFTPANTENYSSDVKNMTVTVNKVVLTPTAAAQDKTYDGTADATVSIALSGAVNGENPTAAGTSAFENADVGKDKTVNVTNLTLENNWGDNYALSTGKLTATASITAKDITTAAVTLGDSLTYTGREQTQTIRNVTVDGLNVTYSVTGDKQTDVGNYTLTVTGTGNFTGSVTQAFSIAKAGNSITNFICGDIIHNETPQPSADVSFGEIVYTYSRDENGPFAPWSSDGQSGTWYVKASVAGTANYDSAEEVISFREAAQREDTPNAGIDYPAETLTGLPAGTYTITPAGGEASTVTVGEGGAVDIQEVWVGKTLSIVKEGENGNSDSAPQLLPVPPRPAAPAVQGVNETVEGRHDGSITGLEDGPVYQISKDGGSWQDADVTNGTIPGLAPGEYVVRIKATDSSFAGVPATVTIATGAERTYTLNLTVPAFDAVAEGYDQQPAKPIIIRNSGNSDATVYSVRDDTAIFTIGGGGETVPAGGSIDTWTIRPNAGLSAGNYTAAVTVTYNNGSTVTAQAFFLVSEATPDVRINYAAETLTGFEAGRTYIIDGKEVTPEDGSLGVKDYFGKTISIVKQGGDETDSAPQILEIPARPAAPTGPKAVSETIRGKGDGKITGIDGTIEYKVGNGAWLSGPADLKDLPAGTTVTVRSKATDSAFVSEQRTLTVGAGRTITVTFDAQGGSETPSLTGLAYGDKAAKPTTAPAKTGYTFSGWYTEPGCVNRWNFDKKITGDLTLYAKWVEKTYSISGFVDEDGKPLQGVTVKLVQGRTELAKVNTGEDGAYCFENVAPGDYNVVAEQTVGGGKKTMTILVSIIDADATHQNLTMPSENVNSILEVKGDVTPDVVVGGLDEEAEANSQTNSTVTITMTVESKEEDAADPNQVSAIKETAEEDSNLEYLAIDVTKTVETGGTTSETPITDTQELIEIIVPFDFSGKQNVKVYRYHGTQVDTITQTANTDNEKIVLGQDRITLYVKKFSTYAIGYASVHTVTAQNDGHGTAEASPASAAAGTEITLTASPSSGYRFREWQVIEGGVTIEGNKFTMPNKDVTVKAIFEYVGGGSSIGGGGGSGTAPGKPTVKQPENGTITISPADPKEGDQVKITVTPNDGYETEKVIVTDEDGKSVEVTRKPDGTYTFTQPKGKVTVTAVLRAVHAGGYETCPRDETCPIWPYTDASATAWYHDGVHYCIENGLMHGYGDNKFGPNDTLTRGMLAQILYNKEERPDVSGGSPFDDVAEEDWYAKAVAWCAQNGVVEGYGNGKFGPNDPITREQLAAMLWRYAGSQSSGGTLDRFTDGGRTSSWAAAALRWAVEQGIVTGKGNGILDPTGTATRAEAAAMLQRFCTRAQK